MSTPDRTSFARRRVLAAGLGAAALALLRPRVALARTILQRGMSGGGLVQLDGGDAPRLANFGLFASAVQLPEGTTLVLGSVQWLEAGTGLELQSTEVVQCRPVQDRGDAAEIRGRMQVNGKGDYPFVARAIDGGRPGSALDRIELEVNTPAAREGSESTPSADDFVYQAAGNLVGGDIQWIIADIALAS